MSECVIELNLDDPTLVVMEDATTVLVESEHSEVNLTEMVLELASTDDLVMTVQQDSTELFLQTETVLEVEVPGLQGPQGDPGPQGPQGDPGELIISGVPSYTHTQNAVSAVWTVPHNLGFRPAVTAYDSAGTEVNGEVEHLDANNLEIRFFAGGLPVAFSGVAYMS